MKSIYDLTPEERRQAKPEGIKYLIDANNALLKSWSLPDYRKKELEAENKYLKELLDEVTYNGGTV